MANMHNGFPIFDLSESEDDSQAEILTQPYENDSQAEEDDGTHLSFLCICICIVSLQREFICVVR